jgi:ribosomal protein S18 acetylase RimI-like enzyme
VHLHPGINVADAVRVILNISQHRFGTKFSLFDLQRKADTWRHLYWRELIRNDPEYLLVIQVRLNISVSSLKAKTL